MLERDDEKDIERVKGKKDLGLGIGACAGRVRS